MGPKITAATRVLLLLCTAVAVSALTVGNEKPRKVPHQVKPIVDRRTTANLKTHMGALMEDEEPHVSGSAASARPTNFSVHEPGRHMEEEEEAPTVDDCERKQMELLDKLNGITEPSTDRESTTVRMATFNA